MNLFSLLGQSATRRPRAPAIFLGGELFCDWAGLRDRALALAGALGARFEPGARISIATANCPEYVEIMFAAWAAGMVVAPLNYKLHQREMVDILEDAGASLVFASAALAADLRGELKARRTQTEVLVIAGADYADWLAHPPAEPAAVAPETLAWLFYTSGTTGRSKGAMLSHRNLMAMTLAHLADFEDLQPEHGIIHAAPMSHGSGLYILPYVARAARQLVPPSGGFEPPEFLEICARHGGVGAFLAPTMVQRLRLHVEREGQPATGLRRVIYGGGPMYLEEIKKSLATLGPIFCQLYGQGEAPMTITGLRAEDFVGADDAVLSSVGWPRSGVEAAVVDENGRAVPPGQVGEIVCRGDVVMQGYWNNPEATASTLKDGWLYTGDMGVLDADGKLTLRDRSKDVIISGGSNIYPREVEEVLLARDGVREVCVVGAKDEEWGEAVVAFVVLEDGPGAPDAETLDRHCLERIARFKRPKRYVFVESLPKSSYGKVLKRELSSRLAAEQ